MNRNSKVLKGNRILATTFKARSGFYSDYRSLGDEVTFPKGGASPQSEGLSPTPGGGGAPASPLPGEAAAPPGLGRHGAWARRPRSADRPRSPPFPGPPAGPLYPAGAGETGCRGTGPPPASGAGDPGSSESPETSNRRSHALSADHQAVTARPARPVLGKRNRGGAKAARSGEAGAPRFLPFLRPRKGPPSGSPPPPPAVRREGRRPPRGASGGPEAARAGSGGCHSDRGVQPGPAPTTRGFGRGPDRKSLLPG